MSPAKYQHRHTLTHYIHTYVYICIVYSVSLSCSRVNTVRPLKVSDWLTDSSTGICILAAQCDMSDAWLNFFKSSYILKQSSTIFPCLFPSLLHPLPPTTPTTIFPHPERNPHRAVLQGLQWENQGAEGRHPSADQDPREGMFVQLAVGLSNPIPDPLHIALRAPP